LDLSNCHGIAKGVFLIGYFFKFRSHMQKLHGLQSFIGWSVNFSGKTVCVKKTGSVLDHCRYNYGNCLRWDNCGSREGLVALEK
jgi:hypothetical protein